MMKLMLSLFKCWFYRIKGYRIGKRVYFGSQCKIRGENVIIGDDCYFGDAVTIRAAKIVIGNNALIYNNVKVLVKNGFYLGERSKISRNCVFKGMEIQIDREFWCNENVEVGGGGWQKPNATLSIGPYTHIGKNVHLNVCEPIIIDGYSGIGMDCMLFTHSFGNGQSFYEGFPVTEGAIRIEKNVSVYSRVIITPGTYIENGVLIGAGSLVRKRLQSRNLYSGIPAVSIKEIAEPGPERQVELVQQFLQSIFPDYSFQSGMLLCKAAPKTLVVFTPVFHREAAAFIAGYPEPGFQFHVLFFKNEVPLLSGNCYINLGDKYITGKTTDLSEFLRNEFRRKGTILELREYLPPVLDARSLLKKGIEL